jgi:hypothetical protein
MSCPDENEDIKVKVEKVSDTEEDEYLEPVTFIAIKTEHEVSCMALYYRYLIFLLSFSSSYVRRK